MTLVGAGGVVIHRWKKQRVFHRDYGKLEIDMRDKVDECLQDLLRQPFPLGLRFEKLKGKRNPDIYTLHVTGNYKISFEIENGIAYLRRVASHDEIDRAP
ncbi:MAG: type II toxin-antitoxin system RelE/ParE family toxin [Zoogloeaceae bacterium]|jgi:mRNA-degrading endonuclease RelE of RelBE toxin-antitoxin system|nr:type II toxin-antitoxin system RelE/ParE family toxin [Zoogloeaceae bacterium]